MQTIQEIYKKHVSMANMKAISKYGKLNVRKETKEATEYKDALKIKTPSLDQKVVFLSGGNQQKAIIAKWLFSKADIFILDEPTRGIDVGAKYEIYLLINELVENGKSVIMISSELPEVMSMSDRIIVVHNGRISGELSGDEIDAEKIMALAIT